MAWDDKLTVGAFIVAVVVLVGFLASSIYDLVNSPSKTATEKIEFMRLCRMEHPQEICDYKWSHGRRL